MGPSIKTGRGIYNLKIAAPEQPEGDSIVYTLALERIDGIERVGFRCRIAGELMKGETVEAVVSHLAPWLEREFEMTRENALKTIRSERRMFEISFDASNRGPF